jgi:hypothetical protein
LDNIDQILITKGYKLIGEGRTRRVYLSPRLLYVIKVPKENTNGWLDNKREGKIYQERERYEEKFARCRFLKNDLLVMEYVKIVPLDCDNTPQWVSWIDCQQVGYNHKGVLVAYDYA